MDFNLKAQDPTGRRAYYTIPTHPSIGRLEVTYAGRTNKGYTDALAKLTTKTGMARRIARGQVDSGTLAQNLRFDRKLFPRFVVFGWDGGVMSDEELEKLGPDALPKRDSEGNAVHPMRDAAGREVEFNEPNIRDLLLQLPDWIMEDLSGYCSLPNNFLPDEMPTDEEFHEQASD